MAAPCFECSEGQSVTRFLRREGLRKLLDRVTVLTTVEIHCPRAMEKLASFTRLTGESRWWALPWKIAFLFFRNPRPGVACRSLPVGLARGRALPPPTPRPGPAAPLAPSKLKL